MPRVAADQREALTQQRRDQIVKAAVRRWLADGFDATSVASIADEAGVAKGTLYIYFPTKQDILDEAIRRYSLLPDLRAFLGHLATAPARELVPLLARTMWTAMRARLDIVRFFVRELTVRPEHARGFLETIVLPTNQLIADHFHPAIEAGELRDVDMYIASRALVGMLMIFLFSQFVFGGDAINPLDDDEIVATVSDVFLHGVLGPDQRRATDAA